jgi:hypothetical protein
LRNYPEKASDLRLIPYWTPASGTRFSVIFKRLFTDEQTARNGLASMPAGSRVVSAWDGQAVYFGDPYFGR